MSDRESIHLAARYGRSSRGASDRNLDVGYSADILFRMSKVLVSIPEELLERIDRVAQTRGSSRSRFLQEAALHHLGSPNIERLDAALERGRDALAGAGAFESAELIRAQRLAHDADDRRR